MKFINNKELTLDELVDQSLLVLGHVGTGKTEFLKSLIQAYVSHHKKVGVLSSPDGITEFSKLNRLLEHSLVLQSSRFEDFDVTTLDSFVRGVDVVFVDEAYSAIGRSKELNDLLDLCKDKPKIIAYHELGDISEDPTKIASLTKSFDQTVFFKSNATKFEDLLNFDLPPTLSNLHRGEAAIFVNKVPVD